MAELTKSEKKQFRELLKKGILRRHAEWQNEMRELLDRQFDDEIGNEFDRTMLLTDSSRKFYKEAMQMEDYYRTSMLIIGLRNLLHDGYLKVDDIAEFSEELKMSLKSY